MIRLADMVEGLLFVVRMGVQYTSTPLHPENRETLHQPAEELLSVEWQTNCFNLFNLIQQIVMPFLNLLLFQLLSLEYGTHAPPICPWTWCGNLQTLIVIIHYQREGNRVCELNLIGIGGG